MPTTKNCDRILALLGAIEDHAKAARGAASAAVILSKDAGQPEIVAPSDAQSLSIANGQPVAVTPAQDKKTAQMQAADQMATKHVHALLRTAAMLQEEIGE